MSTSGAVFQEARIGLQTMSGLPAIVTLIDLGFAARPPKGVVKRAMNRNSEIF
jgi:hypothetical protein